MIDYDDLRQYIGQVPEDDTEAEDILTGLEVRSVALVEAETRRYFGETAAVTWYLSGLDDQFLVLPDRATTLTSVAVLSGGADPIVGSASYDILDLDAYLQVSENEVMRVDGGVFPRAKKAVKVVAARGYETGEEPGPVRQLVLDLVAWQYRTGRKLSNEGGGSFDPAQVPGWEKVMRLYRRPLYGG